MRLDLRPFINAIEGIIARHYLDAPGRYRRWLVKDTTLLNDEGLNPYGCADAANLLYTIQRFPVELGERQAWIATLQSLQDPQTGLYHEPTHHPIHTTAHCIAALELFDARPRHLLTALTRLRAPDETTLFLEGLDWIGNPWNASHQGAGLFAALVLAEEVDLAWQDRYFAWLWQESDPHTGLLRQGCLPPLDSEGVFQLFPHLAGTFHYLFNAEYSRRPLRYPAKLVDTCLWIYHERAFPLGTSVGFAEIDWVYCLGRALRQSGHRLGEARQALEGFAASYLGYLLALDPEWDPGLNDLHSLFGAACCLAELQAILPGLLRSERPLRLVLDRRPFI